MNSLIDSMQNINGKLESVSSLAQLGLRLILAFGFYTAANNHWSNMAGTIYYFDQVLGIPMPAFNAYMATFIEFLGAILLSLGLFTRYISIPLIITMIVAIFTAHWGNGYIAFEKIPENSFLFSEAGNILGTTSGVEVYHDGIKVGDVDTVATGGMEIPVMYSFMLLMLVAKGAGTLSLDFFLFRKKVLRHNDILS